VARTPSASCGWVRLAPGPFHQCRVPESRPVFFGSFGAACHRRIHTLAPRSWDTDSRILACTGPRIGTRRCNPTEDRRESLRFFQSTSRPACLAHSASRFAFLSTTSESPKAGTPPNAGRTPHDGNTKGRESRNHPTNHRPVGEPMHAARLARKRPLSQSRETRTKTAIYLQNSCPAAHEPCKAPSCKIRCLPRPDPC
jgi:hypothetical protein